MTATKPEEFSEELEIETIANEVLSWNPETNTVAELKEICNKIELDGMSFDRMEAYELMSIPLAKEFEQAIVSFVDETDYELFWAVDFEGNCLVGIPQKIIHISELI